MQYENIVDILNSSISSLVNNLLTSIDTNVFSILDEIVFINNSILNDKYFISFFTKKFSIVYLSEALLFGVLLYYSISYFFSKFTCSNFQKPISFIPKLLFSAVFIHFSSSICGYLIDFFDLITNIIREIGITIFSVRISFSLIYEKISLLFMSDLSTTFMIFSFDGILKSFISLGFINLLFTYSIRFIFIKILLIISPFAFLSLSLDQSSWIFKIWLKNLVGQLFSQIFICVILLIILSFQNSFNLTVTKLLYIGSLICLIKANTFVKDFTSGFTSDISSGLSNLKNYFN